MSSRLPIVLPLDGVAFESAVCALASDPGFVAIDARRAPAGESRCSIAASFPARRFACSGAFVTVDGRTSIDTPRTALEIFLTELGLYAVDPYLPFSGGVIGYIGFEGIRALKGFEPAAGFSRIPQCSFGIYETAVLFDHVEGTACIVANGREASSAALRAQELQERLERAPAWTPPPDAVADRAPAAALSASATGRLGRLMDSAFDWLRAEKLSRIHVACHAARPGDAKSAVGAFLAGGGGEPAQALFTHEGACTIASAGGLLPRAASRRGASAVDLLLALLPLAEMTGEPTDSALSFLCMNEVEHRRLYGGAFGTIDAAGAAFRPIRRTAFYADGAVSVTAGADLTPAADPRAVHDAIAARLTPPAS